MESQGSGLAQIYSQAGDKDTEGFFLVSPPRKLKAVRNGRRDW